MYQRLVSACERYSSLSASSPCSIVPPCHLHAIHIAAELHDPMCVGVNDVFHATASRGITDFDTQLNGHTSLFLSQDIPESPAVP